MTTYAFPSITPQRSTWGLVSNTKIFASPFSQAIQSSVRAGERWMIRLEFTALSDDERAEMIAFLAKLNGQENRFTVHDHSYVRRGVGGGTPVVSGASQVGGTINISGAPASTANWLRAGDYLAFTNNELKMVTADVTTTTSGTAAVSIAPKIHSSPTDASAIDITAPIAGKFILLGKDHSWTNEPRFGQATNSTMSRLVIEAVEDILPNG